MKRPMYPQGPTVTPQQFGAKADGKTDDIQALRKACEYASLQNMPLELIGDYYTSTTWKLDNVTIISNNARISYYGKEYNQPAVDMHDNIHIFGKFNIYADHYNPPGTHGDRCGIAFGNYETGRGSHHCYLEHLIIWGGGYVGSDAVLLTGDSSDITFDTIEVPEGHDGVNCVMMMHWGGYSEHHPQDLLHPNTKYVHEEGYGPTKHPHDIKIGLIESHANHTALYISACYNVTVDEVRQYGGKSAVRMVAGDVGFKYAIPEEKAHGAKNIYVKKVIGIGLDEIGIYIDSVNGYENNQNVHYHVKIDEASVSGTDNKNGHGICFYGIEDVQISKLAIKHFQRFAMQFGYANENIKIGDVLIEDCPAQVITASQNLVWSRFDYTETRTATRGVEIDKMTIKNSGLPNTALALLVNVEGMHVQELNAETLSCTSLVAAYSTTKNIKIDQMNLITPKNMPEAIVFAHDQIPAENNIFINIHGAETIPATAGLDCAATVTKN